VRLLVVRAFRCPQTDFACRVFTERQPNLVEPYSRKTVRLHEILQLVCFSRLPVSALEVGSRLRLGGIVSAHRDRQLIRVLLSRVRRCGSIERILLVADGPASYARQVLKLSS
jgi:hypothetical protein